MITMVTSSDGVRLAVSTSGSGTPVVFVHEFSGTARSWHDQVETFSRHHQCITYSARGYPPSDVPTTPAAYSQERAADDLADVIGITARQPAHVVGLSMGGFAALHLGLRHPALVRSLTIAGTGYGAKPDQQPAYGDSMRGQADHAEAVGMVAYARELAHSPYAQYLRTKNGPGWERFVALLAQNSATGMAMTMRGVLATRPSLWHLGDALHRLNLPVLLMIGDEDHPCLEPGLFLRSVLPDVALCMLPRSGHLLNLEEPTLFNTIVSTFLAAVEQDRWSARHDHKEPALGGTHEWDQTADR